MAKIVGAGAGAGADADADAGAGADAGAVAGAEKKIKNIVFFVVVFGKLLVIVD